MFTFVWITCMWFHDQKMFKLMKNKAKNMFKLIINKHFYNY